MLRGITRIGGVEEKSFHPQQKTALVETSLPLVLSYFFMSAAKLGDGTFAMIWTFLSSSYSTSVSPISV